MEAKQIVFAAFIVMIVLLAAFLYYLGMPSNSEVMGSMRSQIRDYLRIDEWTFTTYFAIGMIFFLFMVISIIIYSYPVT